MPGEKTIWVTSLYGYHNRQPLVALTIGGETSTQMEPAEARDLALNLLRSAEAAEADGFVVEWLRDKVKLDDGGIATLLNEFREWRARREGTDEGQS